jgi:orotate phosphoribosyltransferase
MSPKDVGNKAEQEPERVTAGSLAKALLEMGALRFGQFRLPNGERSAYDIDLRLVPSFPDIYTTVLAAYVELVEGLDANKFDAIAGVATAGVTISSPLAIMLKKPMMYVRKEGEGRGANRLVEGISTTGSRVLLVDDLVSTGTSMVSATRALRKKGYRVTDTAVLIDRQEGGDRNLANNGVKLNSYTSIEALLGGLQDLKLVNSSQVKAILRQAESQRKKRKAE